MIEAVTQDRAVDMLHQNGFVVTSIREKTRSLLQRISFGGGVNQKDIVIVSRELSTLFEAQIPIVQALKTLVAQAEKPAIQKILATMLDDITGGTALSQALARHPKAFSPFYVNLVKSGEESGRLQDVFTYLADYLERSYYLTIKARNAMIYPAFIFTGPRLARKAPLEQRLRRALPGGELGDYED